MDKESSTAVSDGQAPSDLQNTPSEPMVSGGNKNSKTMTWIAAAVVGVAAIGGGLWWWMNRAAPLQDLKIVTSFPMTGIEPGKEILNGMKLAFGETDYEAGKFKINLVEKDDGNEKGVWQKELEEANANAAVADPDVMMYVGTYNSGAAKLSIPITNKAGLVQLSPANSWPGLTKPGFAPGAPGIFYPTGKRTYFRIVPADTVQGPAGATWANELGYKNVYYFDDGDAYGKGLADLFEQKAKLLGMTTVGHVTIDYKAENFTPQVDALKGQDIDLIYFGGVSVTGGGRLLKELRDAGITTQFMGPDGLLDDTFLTDAGSYASGVYLTGTTVLPKELEGAGKDFYNRYVQAYGDAEPGIYAGYGYELGLLIVHVLKGVETKDRATILNAVATVKDFKGLLDTWSFDENGDTTRKIVTRNTVDKDGKLQLLETLREE